MTPEEDQQVAIVELRLWGMHPTWIEVVQENPGYFHADFLRTWADEIDEAGCLSDRFKNPR